jgi:ribosomal protein S16
VNLNAERIKYWISRGAQPSTTIHNLLVSQGILEAPKRRTVTISKKHRARLEEKKKAAEAKTEAVPAA